MPVIQLRYAGEELTDARIREELGLPDPPDRSYTYMVATSALEQLRRGLCPPQQRSEGDAVLKFDQVLRNMLQTPLLTRTMEKIFLKRVIEESIPEPVVKQVRHDLFSWFEALSRLAQVNVDLTEGIPAALRERLVSNATADILALLQTEHNRRKSDCGRPSFEDAAYAFLAQSFTATPKVVMEGFTYLTPLQRRFVEACLDSGSRVYFVHPYSDSQRRGFGIMDRTYAAYAPASTQRVIQASPLPETPSTLQFLRRALFAEPASTPPCPPPDGTVTLQAHPHRHGEVAACMARISDYLRSGRYTPDDIALVVRNPKEFDTLLHEQARLHGLHELLSLPPRMLLLTPLGRFALALYEIRSDGEFKLTPEQFETVLASGWLGSTVQETTDTFGAVRAQIFERCSAAQDWRDAFDRLHGSLPQPSDSRLPAAAVDPPTLARWREVLRTVEELCERLFAGPQASIEVHIRRLLDELSQLDPGLMRQAEREVVERIRETLEQVVGADELELTGGEFGEILNSLVRDYQRDTESGSESPEGGRIWVTSPEGIDSFMPPEGGPSSTPRPEIAGPLPKPKKVIFFLGVDDQRVPRRAPDPWPFFEDNLDENQDMERYLFLATVRAASAELHLSYARRGESNTYRPSPYLEEASAVTGTRILSEGARPSTAPAQSYEPPQLPVVPRADYSLHEIAEYGLCPYRYKLERLDPQARLCRDIFQMPFEAQGVWLGKIYDQASGRAAVNGQGQLENLFLTEMGATREEVRRMFGALHAVSWQEVEDQVSVAIRNDASYLADFGYPVRIERTQGPTRFEVTIGNRTVTVDLHLRHVALTGLIRRPLFGELMRREWLLPSVSRRDRDTPARTSVEGLNLFTNLHHAVQWWQGAGRRALGAHDPNAPALIRQGFEAPRAECETLITYIESGRYPKHPGDHCMICPAKGLCLSVPEEWS